MNFTRIAAAAVLCASAVGASAATIDFNELTTPSYVMVDPLESAGFSFTNDCNNPGFCLGVWGAGEAYQADPGAAAVFVNVGYSTTTMAQLGGGSFDFHSIDLADVYNAGVGSTIAFTFHYAAGGSSTQAVTLDDQRGLQTFVFGQHALSSVSWVTTAGDNGWSQFDNINIAAVPEPESYALMLGGLLAVGTLVRRKA